MNADDNDTLHSERAALKNAQERIKGIRYRHKKGMKTKEIHDDMVRRPGEDSPCHSTVKKRVADFKRGRKSTDGDARTERPKSATFDAQVEGIYRMVMNDRRVTVKLVAETVGISVGSLHAALTEILGMKKLSARWVRRMLTPDQILKWLEISRTLLARFQSDPANFLKKTVT